MSKARDKPTQWHPLFAELLRPLLQDYYDVQTDQPVGDLPREADILLLRRTSAAPPPFRGLWRHLTTWNILEFKGPTVDARLRDLSLLVELGLGIDRRLNHERRRQRLKSLEPEQASFWYVVRSLGGRFLARARRRLGQIDEIEPGLWRSQILQHLLFLISSEKFASEPESVPLHLLLKRTPEKERELAQLILEQPHYLDWYADFFGVLHPEAWTEVKTMARAKRNELVFEVSRDVVDDLNLKKMSESGVLKRLFQNVGAKQVIKEMGGTKQVIKEMGGAKEVIKEMGVDWLIANLSPEDLKKLKARLK